MNVNMRARFRSRRGMAGAALPGVLAVMAAIFAASAGWFEASMSDARAVGAFASRSVAFHAAQAALDVCERSLARRIAVRVRPVHEATAHRVTSEEGSAPDPTSSDEPDGWRRAGMLDGPDAEHPFASWPGAASPPTCLIERWPLASHPRWRAYLLTARGIGATHDVRIGLQAQIAFEGGRRVARRWRSIAAGAASMGTSAAEHGQ